MTWMPCCDAGDDIALAIKEVQATQAQNTRSKKEKTYHLIVSFRPEDEEKLLPETFKAIEERFANALGLSEHQRVCAVHADTDHIHMHIAYNLIHPKKLTHVEPYRDYNKQKSLRRQLEKEYGLGIDGQNGKRQQRGQVAAALEAHSGQQSFEGYAQQQAEVILPAMNDVHSWEEMHQLFAKHGLEIKPRGAGLAIKSMQGKQAIKASAMHRSLSMKSLVAKLGKFTVAREPLPHPQVTYQPKPVQPQAEKCPLWQEFQESCTQRQVELAASRKKWAEYRLFFNKRAIGKKAVSRGLKLARDKERREQRRLSEKYPPLWLDFLKLQASLGREEAIRLLQGQDKKDLQKGAAVAQQKGKGR